MTSIYQLKPSFQALLRPLVRGLAADATGPFLLQPVWMARRLQP
jgi:hypothetical protein